MSSRTAKRLLSELASFQSGSSGDSGLLTLSPKSDSDLHSWTATLAGPPDSPFHHCNLTLLISVPPTYPQSPPTLSFEKARVFHPNVNLKTGEICLDVLKGQWSPIWTLASACLAVAALLASPEPSSPLNVDAANLLRCGDVVAYNSLARLYLSAPPTSAKDDNMVDFARVLPPVKVQYALQGKVKEPRVDGGSWNLLDTRFVTPGRALAQWGVMSFADERMMPRERLQATIGALIRQMRDRGMNVQNQTPHLAYGNESTRFQDIKDLAGNIVKSPKMYDDVKRDITSVETRPLKDQLPERILVFRDGVSEAQYAAQGGRRVQLRRDSKL